MTTEPFDGGFEKVASLIRLMLGANGIHDESSHCLKTTIRKPTLKLLFFVTDFSSTLRHNPQFFIAQEFSKVNTEHTFYVIETFKWSSFSQQSSRSSVLKNL